MRRFLLLVTLLLLAGCGGDDGVKTNDPQPVDNPTLTSGELDHISGYLGVIAYSRETGKAGVISNTGTLREVARQAVASCGQPDCKAVIWVKANCAVLAVSKSDHRHGAGAYQRSAAVAERLAVGQCNKQYGDCEAIAYVCS